MRRDEAVVMMLKQCGQRQNSADAQIDAIAELVNAQNRLERGDVQPWWLVEDREDATFHTTSGVPSVATPAGFLREVDDGVTDIGSMWYYAEGVWKPLYKEDFSIARRKYAQDSVAAPRFYALVGDYFVFFPTPDATYPLRLIAAFAQTSLAGSFGDASDVENTWLRHAPQWLIGEAGSVLAGHYYRDAEAHAFFTAMAAREKQRVYVETIARLQAGMPRAMGV